MGSSKSILNFVLLLLVSVSLAAQKSSRIKPEQCGTMQRLNIKLQQHPELKLRFEENRTEFNRAVNAGLYRLSSRMANSFQNERAVYSIPVVFHIVLNNPSVVTDAQIMAQLDTLNKDYFGSNADSVKIPSYFKSLFGKSGIQFCLAQRTPDGESTTGIERTTTTQRSFSNTDDAVKHVASGGADIWEADDYLNIWICTLSNGILGYSTFPNDGSPDEQGVVIDYRTLPGGSYTSYNGGKTLTHETGHYFNLYHIWGDDDGACTGTDYVEDTPNQADASAGCYSGIKTDNCTTGGNGIMYQNYMDYTADNCMELFTTQQVSRMESALLVYRSSLLSSGGCQAPVPRNYDVQLKSINQPAQRICSNTFTPSVTIKNRGNQPLTSVAITTKIDQQIVAVYSWTGNLLKPATADISLPSVSVTPGRHTLSIYVSQPNNHPDEDSANDTLSLSFQYYEAVAGVSESFEGSNFPPAGWDVVNPDKGITWQRVSEVAKTGASSVMIDNNNYSSIGQKDDLRLPDVDLSGVDSAFLSFQIAAATFTANTVAGNNWDTLEVLASTDCGLTYKTLYKKFGSALVTRSTPVTSAFLPTENEWRKDSVNLADYIGTGKLMLVFRNTTGNENNIYLDDVNVRTVTVNPNLKAEGFLVSPNPTSGAIAVQFYPQPTNLRAIQVYNLSGQKVAEVFTNGQPVNYYLFNIGNKASGVYIIWAIFTNKVLTKKVIRY